MSVYTLGIWTVKPGREEDFMQAWRDFATDSAAAFPGATAVLLRDRDQPGQFISCGPWESLAQIEEWRSSAVFANGIGRIRDLLESFRPYTMDPVVEIG